MQQGASPPPLKKSEAGEHESLYPRADGISDKYIFLSLIF